LKGPSGQGELAGPEAKAVPPLVDHVWSNVRVFLAGRKLAAACQLGDDRLGPHLAELADLAVVAGHGVHAGPGWSAAVAEPDAAPFEDGSFDLVVVEDAKRTGRPSARVRAEAERLCRSTGWVVIGSRSRRQAREIRRSRGRHAGFMFVALPGPRRPAVLIDPRDQAAGTYFLRNVAFAYRAPGRRGPMARLEQVRNRVAMAAPARVALGGAPGRLAVIPSARAPASLVEELVSLIRSSWKELELPGAPPDHLTPLVIGHRKTQAALVSVVLLGGPVPLVAKLPRYGGGNAALQREAGTLRDVFGAVAGPVRATIPRPLGIHVVGDTDVLLQTAVPGRHLVAETATKRLSRQMLRRHFDLMFSWLSDLQAASGAWVMVDDRFVDERLVPLAESAVAALGGDARVGALLDQAIDRARQLVGTPLRMAVVHGDYWAGNVLINRGRVTGVVDWERAAVDDLPIWDPVKAVLDAAFHLDRYRSVPRRGPRGFPRWGELGPWRGTADPRCAVGFRAAVVEPGWLSDLAKEALTEAFVGAEIPLGWLPVAIPFHLVREFVHADASHRSVASWGSVLRALAAWPGTWADQFVGDRRGARSISDLGWKVEDRLPARREGRYGA
jgi:aminoglycoside phosphotransferase